MPEKSYHKVFREAIKSGGATTLEQFFDPEKTNVLRRFSELDLEHAPPMTMLVLGSATQQNVTQINKFLSKAGCKGAMVLIVDSAKESERLHESRIAALNRGNQTGSEFRFIFDDMRDVNLRDPRTDTGLVQVVISDYTLNFLQQPEDLDAMYAQIRSVLAPGGRAFIQVNACDDTEKEPYVPRLLMPGMRADRYAVHPSLKTAYVENQGHDFPMTVFPLDEHIRRAASAGLKLVGVPQQTDSGVLDIAGKQVGSFPYLLEFEVAP